MSGQSFDEVVPRLGELSRDVLYGDVWARPGLSPRDRSLITLASHITRYRPLPIPHHMALALENGVTAEELAEVCLHLSFYAGWPNGTHAAELLGGVLDQVGGEEAPNS